MVSLSRLQLVIGNKDLKTLRKIAVKEVAQILRIQSEYSIAAFPEILLNSSYRKGLIRSTNRTGTGKPMPVYD